MAHIIFPKRWTIQPPLGARINFGHPLANGLTFYSVFNAGAGDAQTLLPEGLAATMISGATPAWKSGADGSSMNWAGAGARAWYERGPWCEPTSVTFVSRARRTGTVSQFAEACAKTYLNNASTPFASYAIQYNHGGASQEEVGT